MEANLEFRKRIVFFLKIGFSIGLILVLTRYVRIPSTFEFLANVNYFFFIAGFFFYVVSVFLNGFRWSILSLGTLEFGKCLKYTFVGIFYGTILPGSISGDVAKGTALALQNKEDRNLILPASILLDKIVGFSTLLVYFLFSVLLIFFNFHEIFLKFISIFYITALVGLLILFSIILFFLLPEKFLLTIGRKIFFDRIYYFLEKVVGAYGLYKKEKKAIWKSFVVSFGIHLINMMQSYLILASFGSSLSFIPIILYYSILSVSLMLPITIAGIGLRDLITVVFYQNFQIAELTSIALSMGLLLFTLLGALIGGLLHFRDLWMKKL